MRVFLSCIVGLHLDRFQALEALKVAWPLGGQDDGELEERLQRSCRGLEDFTFEAINTSPVEAWRFQAKGGDMGEMVFGGIGEHFWGDFDQNGIETHMIFDVVFEMDSIIEWFADFEWLMLTCHTYIDIYQDKELVNTKPSKHFADFAYTKGMFEHHTSRIR